MRRFWGVGRAVNIRREEGRVRRCAAVRVVVEGSVSAGVPSCCRLMAGVIDGANA